MQEPRLELHLLGPLQVLLTGKPVPGLISIKAKALLAYLAVERRPVPRSTLAGLLWSDLPEEDALRNLRVELVKLRHFLDPYLMFTHQEGQIRPGAHSWVDLYEFEGCLAAPGPVSSVLTNQLSRGAALYRGDFLSGFKVRGAPLFEEWLVLERERQRQMALTLLERLVEVSIELQDWSRGLSAARKLLSIDSWREHSHRQLIQLLALSGDRPAALAQFDATRRILVQELGVEPGPETLSLYNRIKAGAYSPPAVQSKSDPINDPPISHNLPAPATSFTGRETELEQLVELIAQPDCRLVTLTGPGGAGKTRLALEFCWKLISEGDRKFRDGIYMVSLAAVEDGDLLYEVIVDALRLPGSTDPRQQLIQYLSGKQLLIVLDNFEQLAGSSAALVEILQRAPGLKLLVTSRHKLDLYEEWIFPLEGLSYPRFTEEAGWHQFTAVQLFIQRARRNNLRFSPQDHRDCVIRLCQILEGLPLGIELAAAWVNVIPCETIIRMIEANMALPDQSIHNLPSRQRSLQAVFQYSWDLLSAEEQHCLACLAVFRGGFSVQAAGNVAEAHPRLLANLTAKSLLRFSPEGRYEMHNLLQAYVSEKQTASNREKIQAAHSHFFAHFLAHCAEDFAGTGESRAIEAIAVEINNIRAGWQWAIAQISGTNLTIPNDQGRDFIIEILVQYIPVLSTFYLRKSWFREAEPVFSQAVGVMEAAGFSELPVEHKAPYVLGITSLALARHRRALGQNEAAKILINRGLQLLAAYGHSSELADAWHQLGQIELQTGSLAAAEEACQHSLDIFRALNQPIGIASNLISLGVLAKNRGDLDGATGLFMECQQIFEQRGDQRGVWTCLINLGNIFNIKQDYLEARRLYEQAYLNVKQTGDQSRQALTLVNLGSVAREINEMNAAAQYYQQSLLISQEIGETRIQVASLDGLGKTCLNQGNFEASKKSLLQASALALEAKLLPQILDSLASLGRLLFLLGKTELAYGLLTYVLAQPSCPGHVRLFVKGEIEAIKTQIKDGEVLDIGQAFQNLTLSEVVQRLSCPEFWTS